MFIEKTDTFEARRGSADVPGCKPGVGQEVRHWLLKSSSVSKAIRVFVYREQKAYLRLDRALLIRQKDANLHLTKKCGTGFQKAAQNPEQSSQADVTVFVYREQQYIFKARQGSADAPGCKPAPDQQVRRFHNAAQNPEQNICLSRAKWTHLRLDRALLMRQKPALD